MTNRRKVGIALGSGSARGWAHIGVLQQLIAEGVAPDMVAGCSMGAMIGAAYAAGCIGQLEVWALSLNLKGVVGLIDVGFSGGLIKGDRLLNMFYTQFVECPFSALQVPFAAVATDLATGEEIWLREGSVSDAVRASCTVPGLFRPVLHNGRFLIDGSVVNPVPVSLCREMGAEIVIAVDPGTEMAPRARLEAKVESRRRKIFDLPSFMRPARTPTPSLATTFMGAIDIMQQRIAQARLSTEPPDVLVAPLLGDLGIFEYHRAAAAIAEGRAAVKRMLPDIHRVLAA